LPNGRKVEDLNYEDCKQIVETQKKSKK
jgi:hypothetical protein